MDARAAVIAAFSRHTSGLTVATAEEEEEEEEEEGEEEEVVVGLLLQRELRDEKA